MRLPLSRRDFVKASVATATATAAGLPGAGVADVLDPTRDWKWDRGVCRFCGVGCGIEVATRDGRVVAVRGDAASPVNRGLLCVKGYANAEIPYGEDRLTRPLLRMKDGRFDKQGDFVPVSWQRAFDEMEEQWRRAHAELGPTGVGIMGSGQYTIQEGYCAAKLVKAGWRSNNLDPNARHCMASAVAGLMQTFGIDEPAGCYDDIEATDTVVLWGANMAEMHPMLWARIVDQRRRSAGYRIVNLTTFHNRSSELADLEIVFKPNTDLAIWNYVAREVVERGAVDRAFVDRHCVFATGPADIGFGMRATDKFAYAAEKDTQARESVVVLTREEAIGRGLDPDARHERRQADAAAPDRHWRISFDDFRKALAPYTLDFVAALAHGDTEEPLDELKKKLVALADAYADPKRKVVSYWTMGFNQHTRGTWVNEQAYMVHLLTGKQAKPGSGAFSLTGQPSACGTAREVGTFSHRLPADMVVDNPAHRAKAEKLWRLPAKTHQPEGRQPHHEDDARPRGRQPEVALGPGDEPVPVDGQRQPLDPRGAREGLLRRRLGRLPDALDQGRRPHPAVRDHLREVGRLRQLGAPDADVAPAGRRAGGGEDRRLADARVRQALPARRRLGRAEGARPRGRGLRGGPRCPTSSPRRASWATGTTARSTRCSSRRRPTGRSTGPIRSPRATPMPR